eukprot:CAMPEP_0206263154 /NCGR_PEP_ID=MMETSP0047_2-20121206/28660_1 /ASSEMBLY_ACC=CAM_ASM_000192 /TAXON_ID=195065 /ORGANISM="Chroomonas mesostigmatica_cf, Strain CCMP1168" /LENGTH=73 /DNA_ID=CAMNT_0053690663 /DNA_START=131 /DNA_END=353 /DNA_ORIENTATION=+
MTHKRGSCPVALEDGQCAPQPSQAAVSPALAITILSHVLVPVHVGAVALAVALAIDPLAIIRQAAAQHDPPAP